MLRSVILHSAVYKSSYIAFKKGKAFHRRKELLRINSISRMVKSRVNIRILRRLFWVSGIYYAPYLRADRAAHSLHKKRVIYNSAVRRLYSAHIIFHKVAVLRKQIPALLNPCVRKVARGYLRALTLNDIKPQKLQIKVVVREVRIEYFGKSPPTSIMFLIPSTGAHAAPPRHFPYQQP